MRKTLYRSLCCVAALFPSAIVQSKPAHVAGAAIAANSPKIGVVPIYLSGRRSIVVVRIGNHPAAPVVFDTGTDGNTLDRDYATVLRLQYDPSVEVVVGDGTGH